MQTRYKYNGIIATLIGLGLGIISLLIYAIFDFPYVFLIPILGFMLLFALLRLDKFAILIGALAPLSINVDDVGGGLGMAFPTEPLIILLFTLLVFYYLKHFTIPLELSVSSEIVVPFAEESIVLSNLTGIPNCAAGRIDCGCKILAPK